MGTLGAVVVVVVAKGETVHSSGGGGAAAGPEDITALLLTQIKPRFSDAIEKEREREGRVCVEELVKEVCELCQALDETDAGV